MQQKEAEHDEEWAKLRLEVEEEKEKVVESQEATKAWILRRREVDKLQMDFWAEYAQNMEYARRYVTHMAHQFEKNKEMNRVTNSDFLKTQMSEKSERDKYFKEVVNTNYPTEEFFNQFGTSHR